MKNTLFCVKIMSHTKLIYSIANTFKIKYKIFNYYFRSLRVLQKFQKCKIGLEKNNPNAQ